MSGQCMKDWEEERHELFVVEKRRSRREVEECRRER